MTTEIKALGKIKTLKEKNNVFVIKVSLNHLILKALSQEYPKYSQLFTYDFIKSNMLMTRKGRFRGRVDLYNLVRDMNIALELYFDSIIYYDVYKDNNDDFILIVVMSSEDNSQEKIDVRVENMFFSNNSPELNRFIVSDLLGGYSNLIFKETLHDDYFRMFPEKRRKKSINR